MPFNAEIVRVFIASPSDCAEDRDAIEKLLTDINADTGVDNRVFLSPVRWERNATSAAASETGGSQGVINDQLLREADILVAVFRRKMGMRTTNGYPSGTVEEITLMKQNGRDIHVYFMDVEDREPALQDYLNGLIADSSILFETAANVAELEKRVRAGLLVNVRSHQWGRKFSANEANEANESGLEISYQRNQNNGLLVVHNVGEDTVSDVSITLISHGGKYVATAPSRISSIPRRDQGVVQLLAYPDEIGGATVKLKWRSNGRTFEVDKNISFYLPNELSAMSGQNRL